MTDYNKDFLHEVANTLDERFGDIRDTNGRKILETEKGNKIIEDYIKGKEDEDLAGRDPLTKLHNRRYLTDVVTYNFEKGKLDFGFIMIDIDNFKKINDSLGHHVGDQVLKTVSEVISNNTRPGDLAVRYGGEEFVIYLTRIDDKDNLKVALERIRKEVEKKDLSSFGLPNCTISLGASLFELNKNDKEWEDTLKRADKALYEAKEAGRNGFAVS